MVRLAPLIEHTLLKAEATRDDVERLCAEARQYGFAGVCVNPMWVRTCAEALRGSGRRVVSVVGFPLGASTTSIKMAEAKGVLSDGADELDMVAPLGAIKRGEWEYVASDIRGVVGSARGRIVKVIIESAILTRDEIVLACHVSRDAGAHYVKTSTGFHPAGGATVEAVSLMKATVGEQVRVKASGGIRDRATAVMLVEAGADRLGTSHSLELIREEGR